MKEVLITGAGGFIGSAVANIYINKGYKVTSIDNLSTGYLYNIPNEVDFYEGSCYDDKIINQLILKKYNSIIHIAGQSSGEISFENPEYDLNTNCLATLKLLNLCRKINCKNFIFASTMSVYGDQEKQPVKESSVLNPKSFYAVGKLASENYLKIYNNSYGINTTALRLFNVYGPGQNLKNQKQGMISIYLNQAIKNKHIIVKGSSKRYRDHIYIDDVANAFFNVEQDKDDHDFNVYNVGSGVKTTVEELILAISSCLDKVTAKYTVGTPGDMHGIYANIDKITSNYDWLPKTQLKQGLKSMIKWALKV
jgi:UDP-glucose 4-epimerase